MTPRPQLILDGKDVEKIENKGFLKRLRFVGK